MSMIHPIAAEDVISVLIEAAVLTDFEKEEDVNKDDIPFLTYIQAEEFLNAIDGCIEIFEGLKESSLRELCEIDNPRFIVEKKIAASEVSVDEIRRLRTDLYNQFRKLDDKFLRRRFSPCALITILKNAGLTEQEVVQNSRVNVKDVKGLLSDEEISQVVFPTRFRYFVSEAEDEGT